MDGGRPLSRDKRDAILDGAAAVFEARGYEGASMSMITAAAGVSKGTIYQHFSSKAELFGAAVARECTLVLAPLFQSAENAPDLATALRNIGLRFAEMLLSQKCLAIERTVHAEADRFPELAAAFHNAGPASAIAMMAHLLATRTAEGEVLVKDPEFAAEQFFMLCQTRAVWRRRLGMPVTSEDVTHAVDQAVLVFLKAFRVAT
jgi:AcrR family transcriptional regulator